MLGTDLLKRAFTSALAILCISTAAHGQIMPSVGCGEDPTGDTFGEQPRHDIISLCAEHTATDLILTVTMAEPFDPAGGGGSREIAFFFEIDVDQDPATGGSSFLDRNDLVQCPDVGLGTELSVLILPTEEVPGPDFDIRLVGEGFPRNWPVVVGTGTPTYVGNSITVVVPLALLEGFGFDTAVDVRVAVGPRLPSDCSPNETWVVSVPAASPLPLLEEPGLVLLGISLLVVGGIVLLGRKRLFCPA